jgi:hypothetical protein
VLSHGTLCTGEPHFVHLSLKQVHREGVEGNMLHRQQLLSSVEGSYGGFQLTSYQFNNYLSEHNYS